MRVGTTEIGIIHFGSYATELPVIEKNGVSIQDLLRHLISVFNAM